MSSNALSTVQITVRPQDAVNAMRFAFTHSDQALPELLQNARRAAATSIELHFAPDTRTLTVIDDGCGVNFQQLLAYARSGWNDEVLVAEAPYGLGFMAALLGCERIEVESGRTRLAATTDALLALAPVALEPLCNVREGTLIRMIGCRFKKAPSIECLERLVRGFPVAVSFNGEALLRPHAIDEHQVWHDTPVGRLRVSLGDEANYACYLQGLPIGPPPAWSSRPHPVCHFASPKYRGRTPDRDTLIDAPQAMEELYAAHVEVQRRLLAEERARAKAMGNEGLAAFVQDHADTCLKYQRQDLLTDVPFVPAAWLWHYRSLPRHGHYEGDYEMTAPGVPQHTKGVIARSDMPQAIRVAYHSPDEETMVSETYAWALGLASIEPRIVSQLRGSGHWVLGHVNDRDDDDDQAEAVTVSSENARVLSMPAKTVLCDAIRLSGARGDVTLPADAGVYDGMSCTLYVSRNPDRDVLAQAMDYCCDEGDYDDRLRDDMRELRQAIAVADGGAPEVILANALDEVRWELPDALRNHTFLVQIDERGALHISLSKP
jgi:hypothetical protein